MNKKIILKNLLTLLSLTATAAYGMDEVILPELSLFDTNIGLRYFSAKAHYLGKPVPQETTHSFLDKNGKEYGSVWYRNFNHNGEPSRHVDGFNIYKSDLRGKGDGTKRLQDVIKQAERDGIQSITLWANPAAYSLYKRAGFEDYSVSYCSITAKEYLPMKMDLQPYSRTFFGRLAATVATVYTNLKNLGSTENRLGPAQHITTTQDLMHNDKKYGYISYNDHSDQRRYINYFEISKPEDRAQGHGSQFLNAFIHQAEADGIKAIDALVKKDAYNLYARAGFTPKGNFKKGAALINMERKLNPDEFDMNTVFSA